MFEIKLDKRSRAHLGALERAAKLMKSALADFAHSVSLSVSEEVSRLGRVPDVDYSGLEAVYLGDHSGWEGYALILPDSLVEVSQGDARVSVVSVRAREDSDLLRLLEAHSPWPPTMLPPGFEGTVTASLVLRRVTPEEVRTQVERLLNQPEVFALMEGFGYVSEADPRDAQVEACLARALPTGMVASEDLAWKVLRHEFGVAGVSSIPHWRSALRSARVPDAELLSAFWSKLMGEQVVQRGRHSRVDLSKIDGFQRYLSTGLDK
jgi:hypothetical protein